MVELSVELPELPPSPNRTRGQQHWGARANLDARWRTMSYRLALDVANRLPRELRAQLPLPAARLSATFYLPDRRRRDPGNLVGSEGLKAAIDGLVDAKWIVDDSVAVLLVYGPFSFEFRPSKPGCRLTVNSV